MLKCVIMSKQCVNCSNLEEYHKRGSTSQPDLQITSSIAVNVTDIKHKIQGLEKQLNEVSKHCRDVNYFENIPGDGPVSVRVPIELKDEISQESLSIQLDGIESAGTYRPSQTSSPKKLKECETVLKVYEKIDKRKPNDKMHKSYDECISKSKKKHSDINSKVINNCLQQEHKYENLVTAYPTSSFHSLDQLREVYKDKPGYSGVSKDKKKHAKIHNKDQKEIMNDSKMRNIKYYNEYYNEGQEKNATHRKSKRVSKQLDSDFIEDIIRRQYKPVKMFGRRVSDMSQFSVPVCHDGEFCRNNNEYLKDDSPYYSNRSPHFTKYIHLSDHSDMRSVCDARLYNVNRNFRRKQRIIPADSYDSDIYDLVPVKEKTSPKTRRKFFQDNITPPHIYKEVPPSPRSRRPRLNLKAQQYYSESEDIDNGTKTNINKKDIPKYAQQLNNAEELDELYPTHQIHQMANNSFVKWQNQPDMQREIGTMISIQHTNINTEANTAPIDTSEKRLEETFISASKTDKALCEIKDILQNFLQEIKRESPTDKPETTPNMNENKNSSLNNAEISQESGDSFNSYNPVHFPVPPAPYLPPFGNTCCYPVMPMCPVNPMNCTKNSYGIPSTGLPPNYVPNSNEINENVYVDCDRKNDPVDDTCQCETDELIKEIYKYVSRSPQFNKKQDPSANGSDLRRNVNSFRAKVTSRSAGGSKVYKGCDAKVGTPVHKNVSKSCEAIRSNMFSDTSSTVTNGSYSDTILEKHSLPTATQSTIASGSTELSEVEKVKKNKFTKVMESLGLYRKNKKDAIEELSENESMIEVDPYEKRSPYRQNVTNYMMHEQEYYKTPPESPHREYRDYQQDYRPPYNPHPYYREGMPPVQNYGPHYPHYHSDQHPSAPPYSHAYEPGYTHVQPQGPLCLKEIEVKSIACQSERKLSFFRKITKKVQLPPDAGRGDGIQKNCSTQTQAAQNKPGLFSWKNPQTKAMDNQLNPLTYGYKTQKKLADGDVKMRNAMLKKMFYKKNPFSPRNLIIKTLMGKDKSSFGDAPTMFRPRLFV